MLESHQIRVLELDGIQCNVVIDSIGGPKESFVQKIIQYIFPMDP